MNVADKRRPQDGRLKTKSPEGNEVELRLSTMPTAFGEKLVMRIFSPDISSKDFIALGFSQAQADRWNSWTKAPNGIILVTGPTGSGKSTTLAAMMERRYEAYRTHVVRPFFRDHFSRLDRQIVLVDALTALNAGASAVKDLQHALADILSCFRQGQNSILSNLFGRRIDRRGCGARRRRPGC